METTERESPAVSPEALAAEMKRLRRRLTRWIEREYPHVYMQVEIMTGGDDNTVEKMLDAAEGDIVIHFCSEVLGQREDPTIRIAITGDFPTEGTVLATKPESDETEAA
jgi:hypothetical protein